MTGLRGSMAVCSVFGLGWMSSACCGAPPVPTAVSPKPDVVSASDWSSIRAAYDAGRHAVNATDCGGFQARNPGQQWRTTFDGCGFDTVPDSGDWSWGLRLVSFGRAGAEHAVEAPMFAHADGNRVSYEWTDTLTEWYVNDGRGLEHGYTVHARPEFAPTSSPSSASVATDASGLLRLTLSVHGGLRARVSSDGRAVSFVDTIGTCALSYAGLMVFDADGTVMPARFAVTDEQGDGDPSAKLKIVVDDRTARYPLTIDPVVQQAYLKASNTDASDSFGRAVSISGTSVVVGAPGESSAVGGVDGDQSDNSAPYAGAAYVFVRSGSMWTQQAYLKASNAGAGDAFGAAVAISDNTIVVGAPHEGSSAKGVGGNQISNGALNSGAAYVFARTNDVWNQQAYLKASNTEAQDGFGNAVAVSGEVIVVTATGEDSAVGGVDGDQSDNNSADSGAAYVFVRENTTWIQQSYLKAPNAGPGDYFGTAVSASGQSIVVGAPYEDSSSTGVNGEMESNGAPDSGAAYVFVRTDGTWRHQAYLKASNTEANDIYGRSVAVWGSSIVVGAIREDSSASGINGDEGDNSMGDSGAAYVYERVGESWSQQAYLKASNAGAGDVFGWAASNAENAIVIGALGEASGSSGVDADQTDNSTTQTGAAYLFVRSGDVWLQQAYLKASNANPWDRFGLSVGISTGTAVVGADWEQSGAVGVNGSQGNDIYAAGAAYIFQFGPACIGDLLVDGTVDGADLGTLLSQWGPARPGSMSDITGDGYVNGADLGLLLGHWGPCPN